MSLGNFISHTTCFSTLGNLEIWNSGKRLEKVSFHSKPKERHCHVQLPRYCTHFTCSQSIFQIPQSEPSILHELITSRNLIWILKRQRNWSSNCQHLLDHRKSKRIPEKTSTFSSLTMKKPLIVWITTNCGNFSKRWEYQTTLPTSWETSMQVKKQQLEPSIESQTGSRLGKECVKAIFSPFLFNFYVE